MFKSCPIYYLKFHILEHAKTLIDKREQIHLKSEKVQKEARKKSNRNPTVFFPLQIFVHIAVH